METREEPKTRGTRKPKETSFPLQPGEDPNKFTVCGTAAPEETKPVEVKPAEVETVKPAETKIETSKEEPQKQAENTAFVPTTKADLQTNDSMALRPKTFDEAWRVASMMAKSGMVPRQFENNPAGIMAVMQTAIERNLNPFSALQNMANINGRTSGFGELPLGEVFRSGEIEFMKEFWMDSNGKPIRPYDFKSKVFAAACIVKRKGFEELIRVFTIEEAQQANLFPKKDVWKQYTKRMLQMRARGWALKDAFPHIVAGLPMPEYDEYDHSEIEVVTATSSLTEKLNQKVLPNAETKI